MYKHYEQNIDITNVISNFHIVLAHIHVCVYSLYFINSLN